MFSRYPMFVSRGLCWRRSNTHSCVFLFLSSEQHTRFKNFPCRPSKLCWRWTVSRGRCVGVLASPHGRQAFVCLHRRCIAKSVKIIKKNTNQWKTYIGLLLCALLRPNNAAFIDSFRFKSHWNHSPLLFLYLYIEKLNNRSICYCLPTCVYACACVFIIYLLIFISAELINHLQKGAEIGRDNINTWVRIVGYFEFPLW